MPVSPALFVGSRLANVGSSRPFVGSSEAFVVTNPHEVAALWVLGVDAIITNTPDAVQAQLAAG